MRKNIRIVTTLSKNLWTKFINDNRYSVAISELVIDFSECHFIEPFHIVALSCLIEEYYQNGLEIHFVKSDTLALNEYLSNILFWNYWDLSFNRTEFHQSSRTSNLCLWKLNSTMLSPYVFFAQQYFEDNFSNESSFEPLNISLAELFNNIIDHSKSVVGGYTTNQFYPQQKKLKIAVCDFGVGIPFKINEYLMAIGEQTISSKEALKKAFDKGFSTKSSPHNRGFGLDTLKTIVKSCGGSLKVISNDVMFTLNSKGEAEVFSLKHNFQGTHIEVILDTNLFDEKNNEIFDTDFSF